MTNVGPSDTCVICGVDFTSHSLEASSFTCSRCDQTFLICEFCDQSGTTLYTCPHCDFTALLPRTKLKLLSLPGLDYLCFRLSLLRLRRMQQDEETAKEVFETAEQFRGFGLYRHINIFQKPSELVSFVEVVASHEPRTILEIGTGRGGTLYTWCRYLQADRIISLDLPGGLFGGGYPAKKVKFFKKFDRRTEVKAIRRDSHDWQTVNQVRKILNGDEIDFLFIDGDHTYEGVKQDFEMYSPLVADDGLIGLHDIAHPFNDKDSSPYDVKRFWKEVSKNRETEEFLADGDHQYGIGLVYC